MTVFRPNFVHKPPFESYFRGLLSPQKGIVLSGFGMGQNLNYINNIFFILGVFNKIKPVPKYNNIWSVDTVLDYLSLLCSFDELNLKELTLKLVMLIALTTGQRCQTLTILDISEQYMQKNEKCFNFALPEHLKEDKTQAKSLVIFAFTSILCGNFVFMKH